ncbi:ABC-type amino acid transport system permease component [Roseibium sp. TrichSKD4]|uniref:hypothetical protein n=1 Tax=Roseibium sp. TrichSKD4 TaxID=744980 RepID=UPI0001E576CE|nr:hypothetical protein [Roseibium sp. TrichSKD4]EFO30097.1 ABC-type amino acid transport system permease component [Roseibium sp. TrichSKD4]
MLYPTRFSTITIIGIWLINLALFVLLGAQLVVTSLTPILVVCLGAGVLLYFFKKAELTLINEE